MIYNFTDGQLDGPADFNIVNNLSSSLGVLLPKDYLEFLMEHNGGEGFIGSNYIIIWKAEDLAEFNSEYEVEKYAPGIVMFGSDGGGEGYGFDTQGAEKMSIVRLPFIGMARQYATSVAENFPDLFTKLAS